MPAKKKEINKIRHLARLHSFCVLPCHASLPLSGFLPLQLLQSHILPQTECMSLGFLNGHHRRRHHSSISELMSDFRRNTCFALAHTKKKNKGSSPFHHNRLGIVCRRFTARKQAREGEPLDTIIIITPIEG